MYIKPDNIDRKRILAAKGKNTKRQNEDPAAERIRYAAEMMSRMIHK